MKEQPTKNRPLTLQTIKREIASLKQVAMQPEASVAAAMTPASGDELAHNCEDALYLAFVEHVSKNASDPVIRKMAKLVLTTREIEFCRWYG